MTELKSCPCCGGEAELRKSGFGFYVICEDCGVVTQPYPTDFDAISTWNNRPNPWQTGTPVYRGRYLVSNGYDTSISYFDGKEFIKDFLGFPDVGDIVKWQKIEED